MIRISVQNFGEDLRILSLFIGKRVFCSLGVTLHHKAIEDLLQEDILILKCSHTVLGFYFEENIFIWTEISLYKSESDRMSFELI